MFKNILYKFYLGNQTKCEISGKVRVPYYYEFENTSYPEFIHLNSTQRFAIQLQFLGK